MLAPLTESPSAPLDVANRIVQYESGQAPFYYVLLSAWGSLAGWSEFSARMLSLLAGVLAVAWVYRLAADMHSINAGFLFCRNHGGLGLLQCLPA